jgi:hypothetical protein
LVEYLLSKGAKPTAKQEDTYLSDRNSNDWYQKSKDKDEDETGYDSEESEDYCGKKNYIKERGVLASAVASGNSRIARMMLDRGIQGSCLLVGLACEAVGDRVDLLQMLYEYGVDKRRSKVDEKARKIDMFQLLNDGVDKKKATIDEKEATDDVEIEKERALVNAVKHLNVKIVRFLLQENPALV